jgi:hypothetical protein
MASSKKFDGRKTTASVRKPSPWDSNRWVGVVELPSTKVYSVVYHLDENEVLTEEMVMEAWRKRRNHFRAGYPSDW